MFVRLLKKILRLRCSIFGFLAIKFRYSEKTTKNGPSSTHNLRLNKKWKKWKMDQIFVAFSEYLNFDKMQPKSKPKT